MRNLKIEKIFDFQNQKIYGVSSIINRLEIYRYFLLDMNSKTYVDYEFFYLVPVTIVSAYESFFKNLISTYIDRNEDCLNRSVKLTEREKVEIDFDVLKGLKQNKISIGELFALSLKYSTSETIIRNLNTILYENQNDNFCNRLRKIQQHDLHDVQKTVQELSDFINDFGGHMKAFKEVFDLRHQYIHRFTNSISVEPEYIISLLNKNINFMKAIERMKWEDLFSNSPLTTSDMIKFSEDELSFASRELEDVLINYRNKLPKESRFDFAELEILWNNTIDKTALFFANNSESKGFIDRLTLNANKSELKKNIKEYFEKNSYILPWVDDNDQENKA